MKKVIVLALMMACSVAYCANEIPTQGGNNNTWGTDLNNYLQKGQGWVDVRAFTDGAPDSGTTDNTAAFVSAIATGNNVYVPFVTGEYYEIDDELTLANAGQVIFSRGGEIRQATAGKAVFLITASEVEIDGLVIVGHSFDASNTNTEIGIKAVGDDKDNFLSGIKVKNCKISNFGDFGIFFEFIEDYEITNNHIDDIFHAGIQDKSGRRGLINGNIITDIIGDDSTQYGIVVTRAAHDSLVTVPRSSDITISYNVVTNVTNHEGIDTHGGERIAIIGNTVSSCKLGIVATAAPKGNGDEEFAPLDVSIVGNIIDSGVTNGSASDGISFTGAAVDVTVKEYATGTISGNTVRGHGKEAIATAGGIHVRTTSGLAITGNTVVLCSPVGIHSRTTDTGLAIVGNSIIDSWSTTTEGFGIRIGGPDCRGYVGGNSIRNRTQAANNDAAIRIVDSSTGVTTLGQNDTNCDVYLFDSDSADKALRGSYGTSYASSGTGEDTLATKTVLANSIAIARFLRIQAAGTITNANGNKTIKLYLGATSITVQPADNLPNSSTWKLDATIEFAGASAQRISWCLISETAGNANIHQGYSTAAIDMTSDAVLKLTGECADGSDTITQTMWILERY